MTTNIFDNLTDPLEVTREVITICDDIVRNRNYDENLIYLQMLRDSLAFDLLSDETKANVFTLINQLKDLPSIH